MPKPIIGSKIPLKEGPYIPLNIAELTTQNEIEKNNRLMEATRLNEEQFLKKNPMWNMDFIQPKGKFGFNDSILKENADISNKIKQHIFSEMIYRIYYKSLLLDEDFKSQFTDKLRILVNESLLNDKDFNIFFDKLKNKSIFLSELCEFCEKKTEEKSCNFMESHNTSDGDTVFNIDVPDEDIDKELNYLGVDDLTKIIMDKVVKVIVKEKEDDEERENKMAELVEITNKSNDSEEDEIDDDEEENAVDNDNDETDDEELDVMGENFIKTHPINEYTLFKSIMINGQKEILNNVEELKNSSYMHESNGDIKINMDSVLSEAIARYTLLETLYTIKILDMNHADIRKMSINLTYN